MQNMKAIPGRVTDSGLSLRGSLLNHVNRLPGFVKKVLKNYLICLYILPLKKFLKIVNKIPGKSS